MNSEIETTVTKLLPALEKSCAKMESIFATLDAMEALLFRVKLVVGESRKRAELLQKAAGELDGPSLTSFLSSFLSPDDRKKELFAKEWAPLPSLSVSGCKPICFREVFPPKRGVE